MADKKWIQKTIPISRKYKPSERKAIAYEILEYIRERTDEGLDKNGKPFPKYSKEYVKSLDFKIAGKSSGSIDLRLSGDMMAALDLVKDEPGKLIIGYRTGDPEAGRAEGNIRGTYGQSRSTGIRRDFLGIEPSALREILNRYPIDDPQERKARADDTLTKVAATEGESDG